MKKLVLVLGIGFIVSVLCFAPVKMGVSPTSFDLDFDQGGSRTGTFVVINGGVSVMDAKVYAGDIEIDENGEMTFVENNPALKHSMARYITISPKMFRMYPGDMKQVKFTINPPPDFIGTKIAMIFAEAEDPRQERGTMMFSGRVAVFVQANIKEPGSGEAVPAGDVTSFQISYLNRLDLLSATYRFVNQGSQIIRLKGSIDVKNSTGKTIYTGKLSHPKLPKEEEIKIFPSASRVINNSFETELVDGTYKALLSLDYGAPELLQAEKTFTIKTKANLRDLKITQAEVGQPVALEFTIDNQGTTMLKPFCTALIRKFEGALVSKEADIEVPEIAPGTSKTVKTTVPADLKIDKYTAQLNMVYSSSNDPINIEKTFFSESASKGLKGTLKEGSKEQIKKEPTEWDAE